MKNCSACNLSKKLNKFNWKNKQKEIKQSYCRECQNAISKKHYSGNKLSYIKRNKNRRLQLKEFINDLKRNKECIDCHKIYPPWVMDFDHLSNKKYSIAKMPSNGISIVKIVKEIEKCELVCANCHRERTHKRLRDGVIGSHVTL